MNRANGSSVALALALVMLLAPRAASAQLAPELEPQTPVMQSRGMTPTGQHGYAGEPPPIPGGIFVARFDVGFATTSWAGVTFSGQGVPPGEAAVRTVNVSGNAVGFTPTLGFRANAMLHVFPVPTYRLGIAGTFGGGYSWAVGTPADTMLAGQVRAGPVADLHVGLGGAAEFRLGTLLLRPTVVAGVRYSLFDMAGLSRGVEVGTPQATVLLFMLQARVAFDLPVLIGTQWTAFGWFVAGEVWPIQSVVVGATVGLW